MCKRWILVGITSLILLNGHGLNSTAACGGGGDPIPLSQTLERDILVRATVVYIDNTAQNAVFRVDKYFKGGNAAPYIVVTRTDPVLWTVSKIRQYDDGCRYTNEGIPWVVGKTVYLGLTRRPNGTYSDSSSSYSDGYRIDLVDGGVEYFTDSLEPVIISEVDFERLLVEHVGHEPLLPDPVGKYPRMRPLLLTTETGERMMIPIDNGPVVPLSPCTGPCPIYSPDGSHYVLQAGDHLFSFHYMFEIEVYLPILIPGQEVRFAPNSDFVAVWGTANLSVYGIENSSESMYGYMPVMRKVISVDFTEEDAFTGQMVWSGDSSTIAYQDRHGIWRFDFFRQDAPELIVPGDAPLIELSTTGRYVSYGTPTEWTLLDTLTGATVKNSLISPDELVMVQFARGDHDEDTWIGKEGCAAPVQTECPFYYDISRQEILDKQWVDDHQLAVLNCPDQTRSHCVLRVTTLYPSRRTQTEVARSVLGFAYDPLYQTWAVIVEENGVDVGRVLHQMDQVLLSGDQDVQLVDIAWGTPVLLDR